MSTKKVLLANQKTEGLLKEIPIGTLGECEGDHSSTPYQPSFHQAVVDGQTVANRDYH
jgi:hypothetical protein